MPTNAPNAGPSASTPQRMLALRFGEHRPGELAEHQLSAKVPFGDYVRELGQSLGRAHGVSTDRVRLVSEAGEHILAIDTAVPCGLLLNEILSNSFKHAFPGERSGTIVVELTSHGDALHLVISDDGVGLPADFDERRAVSLGSKLIERLTDQIGGTLMRSQPGQPTRYEIHFSSPGEPKR